MKYSTTAILLSAILLICCKNKAENPMAPSLASESLEGIYNGYRSQQQGQKLATDSTKITLQVKRLRNNQVEVLQTSPNEFKYIVTMDDTRFSYDRGIVEAPCGVAHIKGEGRFDGNSIYLVETLQCTKDTTAPDSFIRLRATKK